MSEQIKIVLGSIALGIAVYAYIPYFKDIFKGKTKPHAFTWLVWFVLTAIGFFAQMTDGAGAGAWVTGFTAGISFVIFVLAIVRGEKKIALADWIFLVASFAAMIPWLIADDPLLSVISITIVDAFGFAPTFRKAFHKPHEETMSTYVLSGVKFVIAIAALSHYSVVTVLYPASLVVANGLFAGMLQMRRQRGILVA